MLTRADANKALASYIGRTPVRTRASPIGPLQGTPPATVTQHPSSINAAAQAGVTSNRREYSAYEIAKNGCLQVIKSLEEHGANDGRNLWLFGMVNLAVHCTDGHVFAHDVSSGWPRYIPSDVDAHYQQADLDRVNKSLGAPSCSTYNTHRPNLCTLCPHWGNLLSGSPYSLGVPNFDLPVGYARVAGWLDREASDKKGNKSWVHLLKGTFQQPKLYRMENGYRISFNYQHNSNEPEKLVYFDEIEMPDGGRSAPYFAAQHITVQASAAKNFREFVVAWIDKLRSSTVIRHANVEPFGWVYNAGHNIIGLAIAGTLYKTIGGNEEIAGGQPSVNRIYQPYPNSNRQAWTDAVNQIIGGRPDIQTLIAVAFASPLVEFSPINGMAISAWSPATGTGKSASARIGQSVWGDIRTGLSYTNDTITSVGILLSRTRIMPRYWDEARFITPDDTGRFVEMLFSADRGRDKMRATRDGSNVRENTEWRTLSVLTGNMSLLSVVQSDATDAGLARLFEFEMLSKLDVPLSLHAPIADNIGSAGREYATWLAANAGRIRKDYSDYENKLISSIGNHEQERFYRAAIICIMLGATYAKGLGLVNFNLAEIQVFLHRTLFSLRTQRSSTTPISKGRIDILIILQNFIGDHASTRAIFSNFKTGRGGNKIETVVIRPPVIGTRKLAVQIGNDNKVMRIDWDTLCEWCLKKRYSPQNLFEMMVQRWGAIKGRIQMGVPPGATSPVLGGIERTPPVSTVTAIEMSIHYPEFAEYLHVLPPIMGQMPKATAPAMNKAPKGAPP